MQRRTQRLYRGLLSSRPRAGNYRVTPMCRSRARALIAATVLLAAAVIVAAVMIFRHIEKTTQNAYAVWNVGDLIVLHLQENHDQWPRSWDDLEAACRLRYGKQDVSANMEMYRRLVTVDFTADPRELARLSYDPHSQRGPFQVVWYQSEPYAYFTEPNVLIWNYLNRQPPFAVTQPATLPATRAVVTPE